MMGTIGQQSTFCFLELLSCQLIYYLPRRIETHFQCTQPRQPPFLYRSANGSQEMAYHLFPSLQGIIGIIMVCCWWEVDRYAAVKVNCLSPRSLWKKILSQVSPPSKKIIIDV
jgi:hypothetical protein